MCGGVGGGKAKKKRKIKVQGGDRRDRGWEKERVGLKKAYYFFPRSHLTKTYDDPAATGVVRGKK